MKIVLQLSCRKIFCLALYLKKATKKKTYKLFPIFSQRQKKKNDI